MFSVRRCCTLLIVIPTGAFIIVYCFVTFLIEDVSYMMFVYKADEAVLSHPLLHRHQYKFILNNDAICDKDIYLLVCISSDPQHAKMRKLIRETWGSVKQYNGAQVRIVFLLAERELPTPIQTKYLSRVIKAESDKYQDIIQANFVDSYNNLTVKNVMGLHWIHNFCNRSRFIVKTDDDVFVNVFKLIQFLQQLNSESSSLTNFLYCKVNRRIQAKRSNESKWYLTPEEYGYHSFPPYCNGIGYIFSADVAEKLYSVTKYVPFISIDDVYIGFCAKYSGILPLDSRFGYDIDLRYEANEEEFISLLDWSVFINAGTKETRWRNAWRRLLSSVSNHHSIIYYNMLWLCLLITNCSLVIFCIFVLCRLSELFCVYFEPKTARSR